MDAIEFLKEKNRMCASFGSGCDGCPYADDSPYDFCTHKYYKAPDKAVEIVEEWSREHPVVTNSAKFREVFGIPFEACVLSAAIDNTNINKWVNEEYKEPIRKESENEC